MLPFEVQRALGMLKRKPKLKRKYRWVPFEQQLFRKEMHVDGEPYKCSRGSRDYHYLIKRRFKKCWIHGREISYIFRKTL